MPLQLFLFHFSHTKVLAIGIVDDATGFLTIKMSGADDELGHVERKETVAIETARVSLGQHECLADSALGIDVTEIGSCEESVVAA